ncbi:MAG TPA: ribonuclease HII [Thermoanaerobaculia bacterium]|nr:ribonuclease HII [Thermoanaerobaculia bacterium]
MRRRGNGRDGAARLFAELARLAEMSEVERRLRSYGFRHIAGSDEVGRGALAGPVVAACVILPGDSLLGVNDSKLLNPVWRRDVCRAVLSHALAVSVGVVEPHVIDRVNILRASKLAMQVAVENLSIRPEVLLLDAVSLESLELAQVPLIAGDRRSLSIAAASVVAKVYRDSLMESYHEVYPHYDFLKNRGYATEGHLQAIAENGASPIHRRSFEGVAKPDLLFDL